MQSLVEGDGEEGELKWMRFHENIGLVVPRVEPLAAWF